MGSASMIQVAAGIRERSPGGTRCILADHLRLIFGKRERLSKRPLAYANAWKS